MKGNKNLSTGDIFAVHTGTYAGEMLIYIKTQSIDCCFLSIPNMVNRVIPKIALEHARNTGIIKFVERAPGYVTKTALAQYNKNEKTYNRREQPDTSNVLDGKIAISKNEN